MSDKVKLPKEVAEAIDFAREKMNWSHANILVRSVRGDWDSVKMQPLRDFCRTDNSYLKLAEALVNGYEIEQTPEDKLKVIFDNPSDAWNPIAFKAGIIATLNTLNIKISGVNAP